MTREARMGQSTRSYFNVDKFLQFFFLPILYLFANIYLVFTSVIHLAFPLWGVVYTSGGKGIFVKKQASRPVAQ